MTTADASDGTANRAATIDILRRLAIAAGARIMAVHQAGPVAAQTKADLSPVTEADLAADVVIVEGLTAAFPGVSVVTEERPETHAVAQERHFLVDPLDGTREFVAGRGEFTVNIALIEGGVPMEGVVYAPALGRLFRTDAGGGAVEETGPLEDGGATAVRRIAAVAPAPGGLRIVASASNRDAATDAYIARHSVRSFIAAGSSLKFCLIAAGEADFYPRLGRTMEWDTAAAEAVLRAAGGSVIRFDTGEPLRYGKADRSNPWFIALGPGVRPAPPDRAGLRAQPERG